MTVDRSILLAFLLGMLLIELAAMSRLSSTHDEWAHVEYGKSVLERRSAGPSDQKMAVTALNYLPLHAFGIAGIEVSPRTALFAVRLPTVLISLALATLVFAWARRLYGVRGAVLSALLYAVSPTVLAHSGLATNDVASAFLMFAATMLFVRYLDAPTLGRLLPCALVVGLAQLTKHTALLLFPIFAVLWIVAARAGAARGHRPTTRRLVGHGVLAVLVMLLVVNAGYLFRGSLISVQSYLAEYRAQPAMVRDDRTLTAIAALAGRLPDVPVPLPHPWVHALLTGVLYNATGGGHGPIYLLGELSQTGWWHYFLVALVLKTPLAFLVLLAVAAALSPRWLRRDPVGEATLLTAVVVPLVFFSIFCTAQLGIRYLLPLFPFLFVAVGKVAAYAPARHAGAYRAAVAALVLWCAASSLSFHPHYLAYFNELIGDRKNMYRYLADSNVDWGQSTEDLKRYVARRGPTAVAVNPPMPVTGTVVVNVNALVGVIGPRERYRWLRDGFAPADHVGYAWLVYEVPRR